MIDRLVFAACSLAAAGSAHAEEWRFSITPDVWATDVGINLNVLDRDVVDTTIAFDDLLQDIDTAVLFRAQAMHGVHGVALDVFDVELVEEDARLPIPGEGGVELALDARVGTTIVDLTGVYDLSQSVPGLSIRYGARVLNQREELVARPVIEGGAGPPSNMDISDTYYDGLIGVRYAHPLSDRWACEIAADLSTGGTDHTWSVNPSVSYSFGDQRQYHWIGGYRYLAVDFADQAASSSEMTLSGVLVGVQFDF